MILTKLLWTHLVSKFKKPLGTLEIGKPLHGTPPIILSFGSADKVTIGKYCSIAPNVTIVAASGQHVMNITLFPDMTHAIGGPKSKKKDITLKKKEVKIGNDVWIGTGAIILSVNVGDGAIIGAGAVVTKNIPPYSIAVGVPARVIRYRFNPTQILKMLKIAWWNWPYEKLLRNMSYFSEDNIEKFITKFEC